MNILGINAYHGDVSAVLVRDGELIAAVEEERFRRIKHVAGFPTEAIRACLRIGGITGRDIQHVGVSRNPRAHHWRKSLFAFRHRPDGSILGDRPANYSRVGAIPEAIAEVLELKTGERRPDVHWVEHHPAHLASAFFVSPFEEAAVCAIDVFGDFVSTSLAHGREHRLDLMQQTYFPHSLGLLYLAITQFLGFPDYGDEFKVMELAPYGTPDFKKEIGQLIQLRRGGEFELDLSYFSHGSGEASMTWDDGEPKLGRVFSAKLETLLGPARTADQPLTERHGAIAASLQAVFEDAVFHVLNGLHALIPAPSLCLAGSCALNSVANGKIRERTPFQEVFIQPAAGDDGTALGAAYSVWNQTLGTAAAVRHEARVLGAELRRNGDPGSTRCASFRARVGAMRRLSLPRLAHPDGVCRRPDRQGTSRRLVPGPDGVGSACAGQPQYPREPAPCRHAGDHRHQDRSCGTSSARSRRRSWKTRTPSTLPALVPIRS